MSPADPIQGGAGRLGPGWSGVAAGVAWLMTVASALGQVVLLALSAGRPEMAATVIPTDVVGPAVNVVLASLGGLVVLRSDARRYGWLMLGLAAVAGVVGFAGLYSVYALAVRPEAALPLTWAAAWVQDLWMVIWLLGFLLLPALFPDGTIASPRWRRPVQVAAGIWVALIVVFMLTERPPSNWLEAIDAPANPTGVLPIPLPAIVVTLIGVTVASLAIGIGSLVARWRRADVELRQRLKWVLYAFGVLLTVAAADLANQTAEAGLGVDLGLSLPINVVMAAAIIGLVVALGFAVLKFRLYDVDRIISRTASYGLVVAILGAVYVVGVVGLGTAVTSLTGEAGGDLVVAVSVLAVVALFRPLRTRVQAAVDRRFNRSGYEARRAVETFAENLRDEVDLETIRRQVARTAAVAVQPSHVSIWPADPEERI